jgi:hypothetical protein
MDRHGHEKQPHHNQINKDKKMPNQGNITILGLFAVSTNQKHLSQSITFNLPQTTISASFKSSLQQAV